MTDEMPNTTQLTNTAIHNQNNHQKSIIQPTAQINPSPNRINPTKNPTTTTNIWNNLLVTAPY